MRNSNTEITFCRAGNAVGFTKEGYTVVTKYFPGTKTWRVDALKEIGTTTRQTEKSRQFGNVSEARAYAASIIDHAQTTEKAWWNIDKLLEEIA